MRNVSTSLKVALFSFICFIVLTVFAELTAIVPLLVFAMLALLTCIFSLVAWVCMKIFHKFKHSVNVILIIIFATASMVTYAISDVRAIQSVEDIVNVNYITLAWIASVCACCVSILVLIARVIFAKPAPKEIGVIVPEVAEQKIQETSSGNE